MKITSQSTLMLMCALGAAAIVPAHADVTWEHSFSVRMSNMKKPVFGFKMFNSWSGQKARMLLKFSPSMMPSMPMGMPKRPTFMDTLQSQKLQSDGSGGASKNAEVAMSYIQDFEGDRLVGYASPTRQYVSEPLKATAKRLRFDPWKKRAPRLSEEAPLELTPAQRARLGAEVRATYTPFLKKHLKMYLRALPNTRTFNGIEGRGYRLSMLMNVGGVKKQQWARVNWEWWLGSELPGDDEIRNYQKATRQFIRDIGGPSASMWMNELYPVLWQMLPQELHQAVATMMPAMGAAREGFGGTPLRIYMTATPPALQRAAMGGDVRVELALLSRDTNTLPSRVFEAPAEFERVPLAPFFEQMEKMQDQMQRKISALPPTSSLPGLLGFGSLPQ